MGHSERESRLRAEFELHIELATDANVRRGMAPGEARRAALQAFGAQERFANEARNELRAPPSLGSTLQDVRYAWRAARRAPMLTAVAITTLATAFALTTSAFTFVNSVLLRALPYPRAEQLALIW